MNGTEPDAGQPSAKPEPGPAAQAIGVVILIGLAGLALWGLFSVGSCTVRGWNAIQKEGAEAQAIMAAADAQEAAERAAKAGDMSDTAVLASAQTAVKAMAVDPASVRFRNLSVHRQGSGMKAVCGEFNAKNRAGGYNGYERFISTGLVKYTWREADVGDFDSAWASLCQG